MIRHLTAPILGALLLAAPALAVPEYESVEKALEAVRSGKISEGKLIKIKRVQITSPPVEWGWDAPVDGADGTTWFYVNDKGRNGDGILFTTPNYWSSGSDPFNDDSQDPYENDIEFPTLKRGYEISVSGYLREHTDGRYKLERELDYWSHEEEFFTLHPVKVVEDGETWYEGTIKANIDVLRKTRAPRVRKPSQVKVEPNTDVKPLDTIVVSVANMGDRSKLLLDGKPLAVSDRRPGILIARLPKTISAGTHHISVRATGAGTSTSVAIQVLAPPTPDAPTLTRAVKMGSVLMLKGENLRLEGKLKVTLGNRTLRRIIVHTSTTIVASIPSGASGSTAGVQLGTRKSNRVPVLGPGEAPTGSASGLTGAVPGN